METKNRLDEIKSLMRRMEDTPNGGSGYLFENMINEVSCKWPNVVGEEEFYNLLSGLKQGSRVTFGYIQGAKIEVPKGKRLNPATNRMNQFDDYETLGHNLGEEGKVLNVIKLTIYNIPWQTEQDVSSKYGNFKKIKDELGGKYGVEFGKARYDTNKMNFNEKGGISAYNGENPENMGHTYTNLNMYNIQPISTQYYLVMEDGTLKMVDVSKLSLLPYKNADTTVEKLKAAGATDEELQPLVTFNYRRFEHSHVLFVSATPDDGIPTLLINKKLSNKIGNVENVRPEEIIKLAKERYSQFVDKDVNFS